MAFIQFKAFLSCSFAPEDKDIVKFFDSYIKSFGLETIKYDYQEPVALSDGIKNNIREADCLIAIATRRHQLIGGKWICPHWIEHEVVYAHSLRKPVAIFAEEDVQIGGLLACDERYQTFSRNKTTLLAQAPYLNRFLMALHNTLEEDFKYSLDTSPLFIRHSVRSREELIDRERFLTNCEIEVECLEDGLSRFDHGFGDIDWLRNPCDAIKNFDFVQLKAPDGVTLRYEKGRNREDPNDWSVVCDPPLRTGQRVTYSFEYLGRNVKSYTREEAQKCIDLRQYWSDNPRCAVNWDLYTPTKELVAEVIDLGIQPTVVEAILPTYLGRFRRRKEPVRPIQ